MDNTTAISYINKMGSVRYSDFNNLARIIWQWAENRQNFLVASYIASKENKEADDLSRLTNTDTEWELANWAFTKIIHNFGQPEVDLFATPANTKCDAFFSRFPVSGGLEIDAFTVRWSYLNFYAFPPFAIILKVLTKIKHDKAAGIVVVPHWPCQPWFPVFTELLIDQPLVFNPRDDLLLSSCRSKVHPQARHISLVAGKLSARHL